MIKVLVVALALLPLAAAAQTIVDGDTIKLAGATYRLWGINAPESKQSCGDGWAAGKIATDYLARLVHGRTVTCEPRGKDRYGRTIALCKADDQDLSAAMVVAGMAWAFLRYSHDHVVQETDAMTKLLGVHAHECTKAWEWWARQRGDQ
jgi:endonuclease YncB( thermonuclease family)